MGRSPEQILEVASRSGRGGSFEYEIKELRRKTLILSEDVNLFLDYVPVNIVTIIENCTRKLVEMLVDSGAPYTDRGIDIVSRWSSKNISQSLRYFSDKKLTIGQLSTHGFSISNLQDVVSIVGQICGIDNIGSALSVQPSRWLEEKSKGHMPIIADHNATYANVAQVFEIRHIIVHEMARRVHVNKEEAIEFLDHAEQFVSALDWLRIELMYGYVPRTQYEMTIEAVMKANEASNVLDGLRGGGSADFESYSTPAEEIEHHWDRFVALTAERHAGYFEQGSRGSIAPMLRARMWESLLRWRIENYTSQCAYDPFGK